VLRNLQITPATPCNIQCAGCCVTLPAAGPQAL